MKHTKHIKNRRNPSPSNPNASKMGWLVLGTATVVGAYLVFSKEDEPAAFPPVGTKTAKSKTNRMRRGDFIVESVPIGSDSLELYQYTTSSNTDIQVDIPFQNLLTENDLSRLRFTETLPKMGIAKDIVDRSEDAVAMNGLSVGDRTSIANRQVIKSLLGVDASKISQSDRQNLANLLETVELAVTSFDKKCPMGLGAFDGVRRQRIWANVLWTVINRASQEKGSKSITSCLLDITRDNRLPLYSGVPKKSVAFVDAFFKGYFNAEVSLANSFFIFTNGDLSIPKKAIPTEALNLDGEPMMTFRKVMEPAWLNGVVFFSDAMAD